MTVKEELLALLSQDKEQFFSGEQLASRLNVTRAAVLKAVASLRGDGYFIDAVQNRGYRLGARPDLLSADTIRRALDPSVEPFVTIESYRTIGSTNTLLKERAAAGAQEGLVAVAAEQTAGRGRRGRSFYSPGGTGLYISVLLRPRIPADSAVRITTMAAVAMSDAVESLSGKSAAIKWVNDILLEGNKVCGILTEASLNMETGALDYAVLGAGVNVYPPEHGFPAELRGIAGSVFSSRQDGARSRLAGAFLSRFFALYHAEDPSAYIEEYRRRCAAIGRRVRVLLPDGERGALCTGVDDRCRLCVTYDDGTTAALSSGEISIRLSN